MRKTIVAALAWCVSCMAMAQSVEQIKADANYIYGEGTGATEQQADQAALADLISKISITVKNDFTSKEREQAIGGNVTSESNYEQMIRSYSNATLTGTQRLIIKQEPDARIFRYVKKSEVDKLFEGRKAKAQEFVRLADNALEKLQIDDALHHYYWALCLVRSLRYPTEATVYADGRQQTMIAWLPTQIDNICSDIQVKVKTDLGDDMYAIDATYKGKPVRSMDYTVNDGNGYGAVYSIRDGEGTVELTPGCIAKQFTLKVETEFRGLAVTDDDVRGVIGCYADTYKHAYIPVSTQQSAPAATAAASSVSQQATASRQPATTATSATSATASLSVANAVTQKHYTEALTAVAKALREGKGPESVRNLFTDDGFAELNKVLSYGRYTVSADQQINVYDNGMGEIVCRGLQCLFRFGSGRTFNEQLTFTFSGEKVTHVSLGIGRQMMEEEIMSRDGWAESSRHRIAAFLEDYRTAYATHDIDYLDNVFDDNAVIIVGCKLQKAPQLTDMSMRQNQFVRITRYTKQQFIQNLRRSFMSKKYINLHFSNSDIVKLGDTERYGIQLKQDYYSDNYGDTGYLYLLVDLNDPAKPVIHVRSWQPEPDPNFGVIGPGHF